jgi:hypothetical protein
MALIKNVVTRFGYDAEYWRILEVHYVRGVNTRAVVGIFKDKPSASSMEPVDREEFNFSGEDNLTNAEMSDNPIRTLYQKIKALPSLEGSSDDV